MYIFLVGVKVKGLHLGLTILAVSDLLLSWSFPVGRYLLSFVGKTSTSGWPSLSQPIYSSMGNKRGYSRFCDNQVINSDIANKLHSRNTIISDHGLIVHCSDGDISDRDHDCCQ